MGTRITFANTGALPHAVNDRARALDSGLMMSLSSFFTVVLVGGPVLTVAVSQRGGQREAFSVTRDRSGSCRLRAYPGKMQGRTPRQFLIVYALILSLLASCSRTSADTADSTTSSAPNAVTVVANEYTFVPAVLTLGGVRTVLLRNEGGLAHTWTVLAEPVESEEEIAAALVLAEGQVEVGQTALIDLVSTTAGRYQVVCAIPGHFSAGMKGEVVIGEG